MISRNLMQEAIDTFDKYNDAVEKNSSEQDDLRKRLKTLLDNINGDMDETVSEDEQEKRLRIIVSYLVIISGTLFTFGVAVLYIAASTDNLENIVKDHAAAAFGIPLMWNCALLVVVILRSTAGPIEFETPFGFKFRGASGPVVLWVLCYLALTTSARILWTI